MATDETIGDDERHCVINVEYENGKKLDRPISWCGETLGPRWHFTGTTHFVGSLSRQDYAAWKTCRPCAQAIADVVNKGLAEPDWIAPEPLKAGRER